MVGAIWLKKIGIFFCFTFGVYSGKSIIKILILRVNFILTPLFKKLDKLILSIKKFMYLYR